MKRLVGIGVVSMLLGFMLGLHLGGSSRTALAGGGVEAEKCAAQNGDVNADRTVDLSDAVTILGNLFLGSPTELAGLCDPPDLTARIQELEARLADCRAGNNPPSGLPATGQMKCYDRSGEVPCDSAICPGQDGYYRAGCPTEIRFVDNGDGTVTDNCTGLMWQKDTPDVNGDGQQDGADRISRCSALTYCEALSLAGHVDWRLPNVRELQSIVDYGRSYPSIDPYFGVSPTAVESGLWDYWSSTSGNWIVYFADGTVVSRHDDGDHESLGLVRAVRGGI